MRRRFPNEMYEKCTIVRRMKSDPLITLVPRMPSGLYEKHYGSDFICYKLDVGFIVCDNSYVR